eukprot:3121417-Pleurochrysis_carterae.AAC.1
MSACSSDTKCSGSCCCWQRALLLETFVCSLLQQRLLTCVGDALFGELCLKRRDLVVLQHMALAHEELGGEPHLGRATECRPEAAGCIANEAGIKSKAAGWSAEAAGWSAEAAGWLPEAERWTAQAAGWSADAAGWSAKGAGRSAESVAEADSWSAEAEGWSAEAA